MLSAVILIRRVPENISLLQSTNGAAHVLSVNHIRIMSDSTVVHGCFKQRVLVGCLDDTDSTFTNY